MSFDQKHRNAVDPDQYDQGRFGCIPPSELEEGERYTARLRNGDARELGAYAFDQTIEIISVHVPEDASAVVAYYKVDEDGNTSVFNTESPTVDTDGIIICRPATPESEHDNEGGYFLGTMEEIDIEWLTVAEELMVPIRRQQPTEPDFQRYLD